MNLENLNLVELNAQEVQEVDGGWIVQVLEGLAILATAALMIHEQDCYKCRGIGYGREAGPGGLWA
jgi:hypothetical protein